MSSVPAEALNELFSEKLDSPEAKEKLAQLGGDWIRDRLREESFARKILPPKTVTKSDLQVSVNHDTMVKIVEVEPQSRAMPLTFRGQPSVRYYTGPRFEVPFYTVASERFEQTEEELMAYTMPITEIIRRNIVTDIQEVEDIGFLTHGEAATQSLQQDAQDLTFGAAYAAGASFTAFNVAAGTVPEIGKCKGFDVIANTAAVSAAAGVYEELIYPLQKDDLSKLFQLFPGRGERGSRLRCDQFLMTDTDFEDINTWVQADLGDKIVGETVVDGFKYGTLLGRRFVRTLKTDILRPGNIYAFAAPEFLGGFLVLNKTKFYADKERNRISFEAWETIGMYFGNVAGIRKLELYAGSVEAQVAEDNSAIRAAYLPVGYDQLGDKNNLVEEGQTFPHVSEF